MNPREINLYDLWQGQQATTPAPQDFLRTVNRFRNNNYTRLFLTTLAFAATSAFIAWIWLSWQPQMETTRLGIVLTILSMAIYGFVMNRQYPLLRKIDEAASNAELLSSLIALRKQQLFLQTTMLNLYFVMLSAGILLYMIEPSQQMSAQNAAIAYGATIAWVLFAWSYLRPRQLKKQQAKLNEIIQKLEEINGQFKNNDL